MCISAAEGNDASTFPNQLDRPPANGEDSVNALVSLLEHHQKKTQKRYTFKRIVFKVYLCQKSWKNKETSVRAERGYICTVERFSYRTLYTFTFQFPLEERLLDFSLYPDGVQVATVPALCSSCSPGPDPVPKALRSLLRLRTEATTEVAVPA